LARYARTISVPITVTTNFDSDDLRFTDRDLMRQIGLLARETIHRRTARGISSDGAPFQRYSLGYAKQKAAQLGGSGTVNLTVSGGMLNALQIVDVDETSVTLGFG
jgi:hypothetical protein